MERIKKALETREGTIVAVAIVCGIAVMLASMMIQTEKPKYLYRCATLGQSYQVALNRYTATFDEGDRRDLLYALADIDPASFKVEEGAEALPGDIIIEYIGAKYTFAGKIKNLLFALSLVMIFLPYPAYLLMRSKKWIDGISKRA
jgi:hypothetical protein